MRPATPLFRVAVTGPSMEPTFRDGDWLLVRRLSRPPRAGEVVVAADPRAPGRLLVKRVAAVDGTAVTVLGDHRAASTDSRDFGPLPLAAVVGRPVLRYAPLERFGPVRQVAEVTCARCGTTREGAGRVGLPGPLGDEIAARTCAECWREWVAQQVRVINHYGLRPALREDREKLYAFTREFLGLAGTIDPP